MNSSDNICSFTPRHRANSDRRQQRLRALLIGSFRPRRRRARREGSSSIAALDWHSPKWLAVALLILTLSMADSLLTLVLLDHGAIEINPLMRFFILEGGRLFALVKLGLTGGCVTLLILMTRSRAFGRAPAGPILYLTLLVYVGLVSYELWLLDAVRMV
jgi:Domain of unknown function (DUF5658)